MFSLVINVKYNGGGIEKKQITCVSVTCIRNVSVLYKITSSVLYLNIFLQKAQFFSKDQCFMGVHAHINRCFVNLRMVNWFIRFSSESHNHPKMICNNFKICLLIFYLLFVCLLEYQHRLHLRLNCVRLSVRILDIIWPPDHCLLTRTSKLTPFSYPHGFL